MPELVPIMRHHLQVAPAGFLRGDSVEVRSEAEIAATLDANGELDGLPFMPEMAAHCGNRYRIYRRADKTCVEGLGLRRLSSTVFLEEVRCDGAAHDGCQRGCLMFWKEAWVKPVLAKNETVASAADQFGTKAPSAFVRSLATRDGDLYLCQSTALAGATQPIASWNPNHLVREIRNGELSAGGFIQIVARVLVNKLRGLFGLNELGGLAGAKKRNAKGNLGLVAGERVVIKSPEAIAATLDPNGRNAGLTFDPDMHGWLEKPYEVERPIERIILEETGKMATLTHTVALKGVNCRGLCSKNCPRNNPVFWREAWLQRPDGDPQAAS